MYTRLLIVFIVVLSFKHEYLVTGITCYECASASSHCVLENGQSNDCDKKYCTIYRRDYVDPVGKIQIFYRKCDNAPSYLNAVIKTPNHVEYYRACDRDLCNSGDGIDEFKIKLENSSDTTIYVVPGVGSNGTALRLDKLIITFISIALLLSELIIQ